NLPVVRSVPGEPFRDLPEALGPACDARDAMLPSLGGGAVLREERLDRHLAEAPRQEAIRDADELIGANATQVLVGGEDLALRLAILGQALHEGVDPLAGERPRGEPDRALGRDR